MEEEAVAAHPIAAEEAVALAEAEAEVTVEEAVEDMEEVQDRDIITDRLIQDHLRYIIILTTMEVHAAEEAADAAHWQRL